MTRTVLSIVLVAVVWCGKAAAQIVYVDQAGGCDGLTPCFTTIQAGVNAASAPGLVFIFPGTYAESVDLSGMAIPGTITLLGPIVPVDSLPAMGGAAGAGLPSPARGPGGDRLDAWREKVWSSLDTLSARVAVRGGGAHGAAVGAALVDPPAGPAIFNSVAPHPGDVSIIGVSVHSPDDDGIRINAGGDAFAQLVQANMNGRNGIHLTSTTGSATFFACTANGNMSSGLVGNGGGTALVINGTVQGNTASGIQLSGPETRALGLRVEFLGDLSELGFTDGLLVSANGGHGVTASGESFSIGGFLISADPGAVPPEFLVLDDLVELLSVRANTLDGVNASATNIDVALMHADQNQQSGIVLNATEQVSLLVARANGNVAGDGVRIVADTALVIGLTAAGNGGTGLDVATSGSEPGFLDVGWGAQVTAVSASGNQTGVNFALTGAGVLFNGNAVVGNSGDGVVLSSLGPGETRTSGNIICSNGGAGLRSAVNTDIVGTASWWGSPSGPAHATKNPAGGGDDVVDGTSGGGLGDVKLLPFIDTVTGTVKPSVIGVNSPATVEFQLTGGNGSVFLGGMGALAGLFLDPPLTLSAASGTFSVPQPFLSAADLVDVTGNPVSGFINGVADDFDPTVLPPLEEIPVLFRATFFPGQAGDGAVALVGPCGLAGSVTFTAIPNTTAPMLSAPALIGLAALLGLAGARAARRRRPSSP